MILHVSLSILLYYTLHPVPRKLPFSGQCERLSRRLVYFVLRSHDSSHDFSLIRLVIVYLEYSSNLNDIYYYQGAVSGYDCLYRV